MLFLKVVQDAQTEITPVFPFDLAQINVRLVQKNENADCLQLL